VYQERRTEKYYIVDGERRWRCAQNIETDVKDPRNVPIPANVVDPPTNVANLLWMFNIHNLREQWELMPTALSLKVLINELKEDDEDKLAKLTQLSGPHVRRCKILLSYPKTYHLMMLVQDPGQRMRANFFIEMHPVLDLYSKLPKHCRAGKSRNELTDHFIKMYHTGGIKSVIHFRRILEAYDYLYDDRERRHDFNRAAELLARRSDQSIRSLFDPLIAEDKSVAKAEATCKEFLKSIKRFRIEHVSKRANLRRILLSIRKYVDDLLDKLEGDQ